MHLKCIRVHLFSSFSLVHIKRTTQLLEMTQNMLIAITFGTKKRKQPMRRIFAQMLHTFTQKVIHFGSSCGLCSLARAVSGQMKLEATSSSAASQVIGTILLNA